MKNAKYNPVLIEVLKDNNLPINDSLAVLTLMHFNLKPSFLDKLLVAQILSIGIVTMDYSSKTFEWKYGLFEDTQTGYEWVTEWMDLFKAVNPDRRGSKPAVVKRMKEFFVTYPKYRVDDIMRATKSYLSSVTDPRYCKTSQKFIKEQDGSSMLLEQLEKIQESRVRTFREFI